MIYSVQVTKKDDAGVIIGTMTHNVKEDENGLLVVEVDSGHTFEGDFLSVVDELMSCDDALLALAKHKE